ncbi:MFS transporter [Capillibacterium thermochitinicola]|uniref:MFS transporter n=1 Tax=Capillibacterium thermochitinicola TaxID=2699427 RepID=A0A8J6I0E8_9FIRM|nr:MFS transporter [Capillibacterium thermochitinicola]MBA2133151.1 MFS transporter [Capillibacterium thermochitinicola]
MDAKVKPTIGVLAAVPFIMVLGNSMLIPVLPAIQKALDVSLLQVGLLITAFSIPAGLTIPFAGMLSDHVGRKIVMVPALIIYGTGGLLAGAAALLFKENAYPYILGARIIQGIGAGGTYQLAMALSGDLIQDNERAQVLGLLEAANGLGKVVSPLAGAAIALIAWYMPFFVYGILALPIALAILFIAKEANAKQQAQPLSSYFTNLLQILKDKGVNLGIAFLCGLIVLFSLFGLLSYFSDLLEKTFHLQTFHRGLIIAVPVLAMAVTSYIFGIVLKQQMVKIMKGTILGGLALVALGLFCFPLGDGIVTKTIFATLIGTGTGMALPALNTLITSSAPTSERGLVTCLYGTVRFFGVAIGPPLFSFATKYGAPLIFWSNVGCVAGIAVLAFFFIQPQQILPESLKGGEG